MLPILALTLGHWVTPPDYVPFYFLEPPGLSVDQELWMNYPQLPNDEGLRLNLQNDNLDHVRSPD